MKRASNLTVRAPLLVSIAAALCSLAPEARAEQTSGTAPVDAAALQSRVAELARRVADLKDRQDIWDASKRYTRGADRHDKDLVRSAFWPEAIVSYGEPLRREEYVDAEESRLSG